MGVSEETSDLIKLRELLVSFGIPVYEQETEGGVVLYFMDTDGDNVCFNFSRRGKFKWIE